MPILSKTVVAVRRPSRVRVFDLVLWISVCFVTVPAARGEVVMPAGVPASAPVVATAR